MHTPYVCVSIMLTHTSLMKQDEPEDTTAEARGRVERSVAANLNSMLSGGCQPAPAASTPSTDGDAHELDSPKSEGNISLAGLMNSIDEPLELTQVTDIFSQHDDAHRLPSAIVAQAAKVSALLRPVPRSAMLLT